MSNVWDLIEGEAPSLNEVFPKSRNMNNPEGGEFARALMIYLPPFGSPIEQAFWEAWHCLFLNPYQGGFPLVPQYRIGKYRVDFAEIRTKTAIELDGHATHSSPDAIAYDRKRQREIEKEGWHVIRFGGKEIYSDAYTCASEAWRLIHTRWWKQEELKHA